MLCYYYNNTEQNQIVRISNVPFYFFEKAVASGRFVIFIGFPDALLEVYQNACGSSRLSDIIPCESLQLAKDIEDELN
jgi:hypothetical protein